MRSGDGSLAAAPRPLRAMGVPPIAPGWDMLCLLQEITFLPTSEKIFFGQAWLTLNCIVNINLFTMKPFLPLLDGIVAIYPCKAHTFLYVLKNKHTGAFLPRISKAAVSKLIKSPGLYDLTYRIYTNEAGYEAIYINTAAKLMTEKS